MSSRRKSRPVRRLDMICSKLQSGPTAVPSWLSNGTQEEGYIQPYFEEYRDDASFSLSPEVQPADIGSREFQEIRNWAEPPMNTSVRSNPPEGVYILQPEAVSDDEEGKAFKHGRLTPKPIEVRKRSLESSSHEPASKRAFEGLGLDLSIKRPRIEEDQISYGDHIKPKSAPHSKTTSPNLFLNDDHNMDEQMDKYHQLLLLVNQQKPLVQALEEVGLSAHEFFSLHRLNNQLSAMASDKSLPFENQKVMTPSPTSSTMFEKFSAKELPPSSMPRIDDWTSEKETREAKIQSLLREANEDVIQQQKLTKETNNPILPMPPMGVPPSMSTALVTSFSRNPDQNREEHQDFLKNLFLKAQGYFSQQTITPIKSKDNDIMVNSTPNQLDRSTASKNDSITAGTVSSGVGSIKKGTLDPANFDEDVFDQYIAKFTNMNRCGALTCPYFTRDHYHCVVEDCNYQRFTNKADVIRHYNMHKKRDNSLAHGFLRFSPTEDCSTKYGICHLNGKSTHYHCMQPDCSKVYTSTSDVMTHENFHKKYMQFVCSGFKRFRATEKCDLELCQFRDQKTTHFHCTRDDCNFTFKNKCDIEKHKTYHLRDDAYISKGFKKYYKNEACSNDECVWNYTANHFHCLRPGCNFSFTSTSQMESHRRKHDRNEFLGEAQEEGKATTSSGVAEIEPEAPVMASVPQKYATMTHYKLPPKKFKFSSFVPPTVPAKSCHGALAPQSKISQYPYSYPINPRIHPLYNTHCHPAISTRTGPSATPNISSGPPPSDRPYLSHSLLSPFSPYMSAVASCYLPKNSKDLQSSVSPRISMFNPALFQEAARKLLYSMPNGSLPLNNQLLYKSITSQADVSVSQPQSGPASPSTPVSVIRNFSSADIETPPKLFNSDVPIKEEPSWKAPPPYVENAQVPNTSSPNLNSSEVENGILVSKAKNLLEVSRADWPRANASGVISPSMALSAAAALKPSNNPVMPSIVSEAQNETMEIPKPVMEKDFTAELNNAVKDEDNKKALVLTNSAFNSAFKYFASASPFNCWIPDCDFTSKQHFHCLVENCGAMFFTGENVMKHAKFHQTLESMGAELPIQTVAESKKSAECDKPLLLAIAPNKEKEPSSSPPPPGYIALESTAPKQSWFETPKIKTEVSSPNDIKILSVTSQSNEATTPFTPLNGLPMYPIPKFTAQMYASAMLKGVSTPTTNSEVPFSQPLLSSTPSSSAYRFLQSQAAIFGNMDQSTPSKGGYPPPATSGNEESDATQSFVSEGKREIGFIHIKAGMACLRMDCKYVQQNHWHCTINRCRYVCKSLGKAQTHRQAHDSLEAYARSAKLCFRSYSVKKPCPNTNCEFRLRGHYHCLKPGCQFATIGTSKLPWHMKKHEKIARREASGFKYFTKKEQCNHFDCKYNGLFSHYHCVRTGCTFAFQYKHQMSTHVRKHLRRMLGRSYTGDVQDIDHTNVDSGDDSLPLIIDEVEEAEQRPGTGATEEQQMYAREPEQQTLSKEQMEVLERMTKQMKNSFAAMTGNRDVIGTGQEDATSATVVSTMESTMDENESNTEDDNSSEDFGALDLSSLAAVSSKSNESGGQVQNHDIESYNEDSMSNGLENSTDEGNMEMDIDESNQPGQSPTAKTSPGRGPYVTKFKLSDVMMDGFKRFETSENCGEENCPYLYKVSHYHCTRDHCSYRFTGRTHMFKHQQHHDRVSGLVRDDFKRIKASNSCDDETCEFRCKNTHFHCLRCDFKCTDSAKVGTHRRQHIKSDTLEQSGFQRVRGKDDCGRESCKYRFRNMSHFHCLQPGCMYTVVGLTGIELHAEKHRRGLLQSPATPTESAQLIMQNFNMLRNMQQQMFNASVADKLMLRNGEEEPHNLSLPVLPTFRQISSNPQTPTSPPGLSESGSNQASPFMMASPNDSSHLLSKFAFLTNAPPSDAMVTAASSPNSVGMVTESVGS